MKNKIFILIGLGAVVLSVGGVLGVRLISQRRTATTPAETTSPSPHPPADEAGLPTPSPELTASPEASASPPTTSPTGRPTATKKATASPAGTTTATTTATPTVTATSASPTASATPSLSPSPSPTAPLAISSSAFASNQRIPVKYTCDAQNINPPLAIANPPAGTQSFALIMDDPDAPGGTTQHWLVWNIGASATEIAEGSVPAGATQGMSYTGAMYAGPCPPQGDPNHRYFFRLYALDATLSLASGSTRSQLDAALAGHILAQAELVGLYGYQ